MSKLVVTVTVALAVAYFVSITTVSGQIDNKKCKSVVADLTKRQLGGIAKCTKSIKFKNGKDKAAKSNCILRCVMQGESILDDKGYMTVEIVDEFITKNWPTPEEEALRVKIKNLFAPCVDEHAKGIDPTDEFCKSYEPVIKCFSAKLPLLCVGD